VFDRVYGAISQSEENAEEVLEERPEKTEGPTSGRETAYSLEFLVRLVAHSRDEGQVMQRY
jgi:hypothetical protein